MEIMSIYAWASISKQAEQQYWQPRSATILHIERLSNGLYEITTERDTYTYTTAELERNYGNIG